MILAQIEDGIVVNVIEVDPSAIPDWAAGWPEAGEAGPGWLWDGEAFTPPPEPETDPAEALAAERAGMVCSRFQAKAALHLAGLLPAVEAAIAQADPLTQMAWAEAVEYSRHSPAILALAGALELTDEQVDDLFRTAMQIEA